MNVPQPPACREDQLPDPGPMTAERMAHIAKALAHPNRLKIIQQFLVGRPHTVQDIVGECVLAQSTTSEHLRILREANVLFATKDGPRTWYCLRRSVLAEFSRAVDDLCRISACSAIPTKAQTA